MNDQAVQTAILDALNQHNSYLQRLSSSSVNEILNKFDGFSIEMLNKLRDLLDDLSESEKAALASGKYTTPSLKEIQGVIMAWQQSISITLPEIFTASAVALAVHEVGFIYSLVDKNRPELEGEKFFNKIRKLPYTEGQLVDLIFPNIAEVVRKKVEYVIRDGIYQGQATQQIIQRIKGTKKLNYSDGLLHQTRNAIDAEVRTARAHVSNIAYLDTWKALGFEYTKDVATLDGRTSLGCAAKDGRIQQIGEGHQKPPYHRRCRTVQIGCDKEGDLEGVRPFVADNRPVKNIPKDQRNGKIGQVDANTTYKEWFARQDDTFQRNLLGKTRFELYKSGEFPIDKFVDPLSGKKFTIAELRQMDEQTFKELGL